MKVASKRTKTKNFKRTTITRLIVLGVLVAIFVTLTLLKNSKAVCEFFARTFSRAWIFIFGNLFGWLPISLYELFLIAAIVGAIVFVVSEIVFLAKRKWHSLISATLIVAISVFAFVNIYTASASFAYGREALPDEVYTRYKSSDLSREQAFALAEAVIDQMNADYRATVHDADGNIVYPFTFREMSDLLAVEYERLDSDYFSPYTPRAKRIINKTIMSEMGITGVFFAPFGEANVNGNEVANLYTPHTMAHEMAHGKGVMRENDANLVAYYICLTSDNPYLRYGALVRTASEVLSLVRLYPNHEQTYQRLRDKIDEGIWTERSNVSTFRSKFNTLTKIGNFFNDLYLKLNRQKDGVGSYDEPGQNAGTGKFDDDNNEIKNIYTFSSTQNILIKLFKDQGK